VRANDLELLGLDSDADEVEVLAAYHRRRVLYEGENPATYNLYTDEERHQLLSEIDGALARLMTSRPSPQPAPQPLPPPPIISRPEAPAGPEPDRVTAPGAYLRYHRLARGLTLGEIARETKILQARLEALESENPATLPAPVFVRGFVVNVARLLDLPEPDGLARTYLGKVFGAS
jgi:hypothetical protein